MTRLAIFDARPYEHAEFDSWAQQHPDVTLEVHAGPLTDEGSCAGVDGVVLQPLGSIHDPALYAALADQGVRVMALRMAGFDCVLPDVARRHGIAVTNVPAYSPQAVAEMALLMVLRLNRRLGCIDARAAAHDYRYPGLMGREVRGQTVGIVGCGRIGSVMARFCRGLGADVLAYDINPRLEFGDVVTFVASLDELLERSDVVSLHTPLTDVTRGFIDEAAFARMRPGALLVNCARGPLVDADALVGALDAGRLGGVGLDVMEGEDGIFDSTFTAEDIAPTLFGRLAGRDNVVLTPHVAFFTDTSVRNMAHFALDNALAVATGCGRTDGAPVDLVN